MIRLLPRVASAVAAVVLVLAAERAAAQAVPEGPLENLRLAVDAGAHARRQTPVSFPAPLSLAPGNYRLVPTSGAALDLQVDRVGRAWFVLDELPAHAHRVYRVLPGADAAEGVRARSTPGGVAFAVEGTEVLRYNAEPTDLPRPDIDPVYRRGGYIHPVRTPSGRILTGDYPPDHVHHHGIWAAWTKTEYEGRKPDFWNVAQGTGSIVPLSLDSVWSGPVQGGFVGRHRYIDVSAEPDEPVLDETWDVRVYDLPASGRPYRVFDLEVVQNIVSDSPLLLPEYRYGGVGFRGPDAWLGEENAFFLTSEGRDRSDGHATRARWAHVGGFLDGELAGVGILGHPENFRAPQPMRIHPTEPFFNWAPSQAGDWSIQPGEPYVARYRFITYDGPPDPVELERMWRDYADPPRVTVLER